MDCIYDKLGDEYKCSECGHTTPIKGLRRNCNPIPINSGWEMDLPVKKADRLKIRQSNLGDLLKQELSWLGIKDDECGSCGDLASKLNQLGPEWAKANMERLLDFFEKRAEKLKKPYNRFGARAILNLAILRCEWS